jgi:hypothetical protein
MRLGIMSSGPMGRRGTVDVCFILDSCMPPLVLQIVQDARPCRCSDANRYTLPSVPMNTPAKTTRPASLDEGSQAMQKRTIHAEWQRYRALVI